MSTRTTTGRLDISGWLGTCREFWALLRWRSLDTACYTRSALMRSIRRWAIYKRRQIMERNAKNVMQQQISKTLAAPEAITSLNLRAMAFDQNMLQNITK